MESIITKLDPTKKYICLISQKEVPRESANEIIYIINDAKEGKLVGIYVPSIEKTLRFVEIGENVIEVKLEK